MINFLHRHRNSNADSPRSRRMSLDRCLVQSLRFTVPAFRNEVRARKTEPTTTTQDRARRRAFEQICLLTNGGLIGVGRLPHFTLGRIRLTTASTILRCATGVSDPATLTTMDSLAVNSLPGLAKLSRLRPPDANDVAPRGRAS